MDELQNWWNDHKEECISYFDSLKPCKDTEIFICFNTNKQATQIPNQIADMYRSCLDDEIRNIHVVINFVNKKITIYVVSDASIPTAYLYW